MNFLEQNIEDYITYGANSNDTNIIFECDQLDYYDLPNQEDVSEGLYAAMIMGFQNHKDRFKIRYIDVCYKVFSDIAYRKYESGIADSIPYSYIRVRLMKESDEERRFCAFMSKLCNKTKFTADELIGAILLITLSYKGNGEVYVEKYSLITMDESWFVEDISD